MYGFNGKMLFVDLSTGQLEDKELTQETAYAFIGGIGLGAKVLYDMMPANCDPLGPDNVLGFVTGVLNGTKAFFSGRYTMVYKSPISGGWSDSNSGGKFGPELKKTGYDAVFIKGVAEKPVYLWINDGKVEIRDASHLWGLDAYETQEVLKEELNDARVSVCAIGPAGENVSLISCPVNDEGRVPARGGSGAVMGSKKLKAIAVRGTGKIEVFDDAKLMEINKKNAAIMKEHPAAQALGVFGTGVGTGASVLSGDAPVKNYAGAGIVDYGAEDAELLGSPALDRYKVKPYHCASCPLGCGAIYEVNDGRWPVGITERPEYETAAGFGASMMVKEADVLLKCNHVCNSYGLDTISASMTISWAMECYENGVLSKEELDGIELTWGNGEAIVAIMEKMAKGEGCGKILANGSAYAVKFYGKGEEYLTTACGIEIPAHDARFAPGFARTYKYAPAPGRHTQGGLGPLQANGVYPGDKYVYQDTGAMDAGVTSALEIVNSCGVCLISGAILPPTTNAEYISAVTGMNFDEGTSYFTGLRILNMRQAFNVREGIKPADLDIKDRLVGKPPLTEGPLKDVTVDVDLLGKNFFEAVGWNFETGKPSLEMLQQLGHLDNVIKDLYPENS